MKSYPKLIFRLHAANKDADGETIIITVYEPDPLKWNRGSHKERTT